MKSVTQTQHLIWDSNSGRYYVNADTVNVDPTVSLKVKGKKPTNLFIKGPIPWDWLVRASALPGKALVVGLCLWRLKGATRKNTISLGNSELTPFGIDRAAKSRAIAALEGAALIEVTRNCGRWSDITLLT
jgi:hypothetical protein